MKSYKRVASAVLGMAMAASCMAPITAFAAEDFQQPTDNTVIANHPNDETMLHSTPVYRIGTKSFYKVNDDGSVTYADQDTAGFKAVPAAYIMGSSYNTVGEYGIYTTTKSDGSKLEHFVKISDCQEANGKVNWNHGTADEAKVSDDTKANGVDTASNEDPTMSTQFYIYLDNNSEIPEETPPTEEEHPGVATDDGRVEYDITVATVNHVNVKATVPLYVCMYGSNSSGAVVEPTNYRITNYSTVAIQVKNIKTSGPWTVKDVPGMEYYTGTDYGSSSYTMSNNTLHRGELYMRLRDKVLTDGDNAIDHSDTAWVIPKATGDFLNNKITGTAMRVPMAVYTATGNVNDANVCTPVTKVTYTIAPYGGTMPDEAEFEKIDSQDWLKDAS